MTIEREVTEIHMKPGIKNEFNNDEWAGTSYAGYFELSFTVSVFGTHDAARAECIRIIASLSEKA